jgi:hypothetical protein
MITKDVIPRRLCLGLHFQKNNLLRLEISDELDDIRGETATLTGGT